MPTGADAEKPPSHTSQHLALLRVGSMDTPKDPTGALYFSTFNPNTQNEEFIKLQHYHPNPGLRTA